MGQRQLSYTFCKKKIHFPSVFLKSLTYHTEEIYKLKAMSNYLCPLLLVPGKKEDNAF